ncbi:MAG TPA: helix-turn-helix transcriptional regulator [Casimicrobiaceae bacterium]|jgi:predicted XRE-type DNA-binding protein
MNSQKKAKLEAAGWAVGSAKDFLNLSDAEAAYVETKVALGEKLRSARTDRHLSQIEVAKRLRSSQSRVAKMEAADPSVSVDLLIRSLFRLGESGVDIFGALSTALMEGMSKNIAEPKSRRRPVVRRDGRVQHA